MNFGRNTRLGGSLAAAFFLSRPLRQALEQSIFVFPSPLANQLCQRVAKTSPDPGLCLIPSQIPELLSNRTPPSGVSKYSDLPSLDQDPKLLSHSHRSSG